MTKRLTTPWFPAEIKPVHVGVYQVKNPDDKRIYFARWNGMSWGYANVEPKEASSIYARSASSFQARVWRGRAAIPC